MAKFIPYSIGRMPNLIEPTPETILAFEELIRWAEVEAPGRVWEYMDKLCMLMALVNQRFARKMSFGPSDPSQRRPELAWRIPVRRISGRYYLGWKVREVPQGWQLYNNSREAYFIEFGINWLGERRRVRRPIRKLSLRQTLEYMLKTAAYHRIWCEIFVHKGKGFGFTQHVQSPGMGGFTGPLLGKRLP